MSVLLKKLKLISKLIKAKGLMHEQYGVIKDNILYFNNGVLELELPIEIPLNCAINLHQLLTCLSSFKGEGVLIAQENKLILRCDEIDYTIDTRDSEAMNYAISYFNIEPQVQCDNPQIFKKMCKLGVEYILPIENKENINYAFETLTIVNGLVTCSDRKNILQGALDFNMPNCAFSFETIKAFNDVAKDNIVAMDYKNNNLIILLDNDLKLYLTDLGYINPEKLIYGGNMVNSAFNSYWKLPTISIPELVKAQLNLINKLTSSSTVYFTSSFCEANNQQINFPSFTTENFAIKTFYKHLKNAFEYTDFYLTTPDGLAVLSNDNLIRCFFGNIKED